LRIIFQNIETKIILHKTLIMGLLDGKTAIITGAARGIGKAIALQFAKEGANVVITDLALDDNTSSTEKEIAAYGVKGKAYNSNAAKFEDAEQLINDVHKEFGSIDIVVNNAGITKDNLLMRMTEADWDAVIAVNLKSVFNMTKAVQRVMLKQRSGSIINMSSVVGIEGNAGQSNYAASKAGLIGFTKSIAQELGSRGIRVNAVAPGFIATAMTDKLPDDVRKTWVQTIPLRREGQAEDVANVCLFLGSDLSSYVTGQVVSVCGGMHT
jgi:3-oxoacyl-[acyl-carrier protein] reductase